MSPSPVQVPHCLRMAWKPHRSSGCLARYSRRLLGRRLWRRPAHYGLNTMVASTAAMDGERSCRCPVGSAAARHIAAQTWDAPNVRIGTRALIGTLRRDGYVGTYTKCGSSGFRRTTVVARWWLSGRGETLGIEPTVAWQSAAYRGEVDVKGCQCNRLRPR